MAKRGRSESVSARECPVCLEALTMRGARTETRPFQCEHSLCRSCNEHMARTDDRRCPQCRAPRIGMSHAEAEPLPDRNHDLPFMDGVAVLETPDELNAFATRINALSQSLAAGMYGQPPGARRPNTGHVMRFPVQPPAELTAVPGGNAWPDLPPPGEIIQQSFSSHPSLSINGAIDPDLARTLEAIGALPTDVIQALLDVPDVSIPQWHAMREQQAPPQPRARRSTPRRNRAQRIA